jgi:hypothetical protein
MLNSLFTERLMLLGMQCTPLAEVATQFPVSFWHFPPDLTIFGHQFLCRWRWAFYGYTIPQTFECAAITGRVGLHANPGFWNGRGGYGKKHAVFRLVELPMHTREHR